MPKGYCPQCGMSVNIADYTTSSEFRLVGEIRMLKARAEKAEEDLAKCREENGRIMGVINYALACLGMGNSVKCHDELMKELRCWKQEQAKAEGDDE